MVAQKVKESTCNAGDSGSIPGYLQGSNGETDIENRIMDTAGGEEGEGELYGESNMETYITICKIESQQEFAVWFSKLKQGLCKSRGV